MSPWLQNLYWCLLHSQLLLPTWQLFKSERTALPSQGHLSSVSSACRTLSRHLCEPSLQLGHPPAVCASSSLSHRTDRGTLCVWQTQKIPSMKVLHLSHTLGVERNKSLSFCYLCPLPHRTCHFAFKEDVTYIFLHKLRAFICQAILNRRVCIVPLLLQSWSGLLRSYLWAEC
jgi:hypothetical protein